MLPSPGPSLGLLELLPCPRFASESGAIPLLRPACSPVVCPALLCGLSARLVLVYPLLLLNSIPPVHSASGSSLDKPCHALSQKKFNCKNMNKSHDESSFFHVKTGQNMTLFIRHYSLDLFQTSYYSLEGGTY